MEKTMIESREVIHIDNVSVCYRTPSENYTTFKEYVIRLLQGRVQHKLFWALQSVSLSVDNGEVFGLIGRNGAGKSTLLKLVARVLTPTSGRVMVFGRVAPLLEIGAGFHPDLSGRENVYLNGALLGNKRRSLDEHLDSIVRFAELERFIDAPLRTYSSGMVARLGFAVATEFRPDVLIVDEILGVGDEAFQKKCLDRILFFSQLGTTIFLVSHSSDMIEAICHRVAWLDNGQIRAVGETKTILKQYHHFLDSPAD